MDKMKRILLVDDESDVCLVLEQVLIEHGYVVHSYEHPLVALDKFKPYLYNLVILDIRMPDLNGFALYREIRRLDKKVKICFLTAAETTPYYGVYSDIFSSIPANCFIRKPIENEELMKRINEIIYDTNIYNSVRESNDVFSDARAILMLDDEFDIMSIFTQALEQQGFHVIGFTEPLLALDHFQKNSHIYWLIISDVRMPLMDGYQFIKRVKEIKHDMKIFVMSAYLSDDIQFRTGLSVKVDEYIEKPITLDDFMRLVKKYSLTHANQ